MCEEAADEIERLQWLASEQAKDIVMLGQLAGQSAAHEARIAALEAALRAIAREVARAALPKGAERE
jgi:hypothetical protein